MDTKWFYEEKLRLDSEGHSHSGVSKRDESDREWKETLESGLKGQLYLCDVSYSVYVERAWKWTWCLLK